MATQLIYMEDFDVLGGTAGVVGVSTTDDERVDIRLDKTCFYPRGGGQDWDEGTIVRADGSAVFTVQEARLDEHGEVHHLGSYAHGELRVGDEVQLVVDAERRNRNTRLHSAGHLIDMALDQLGYDWAPLKGAHYPDMSFVEYMVDIDPETAEGLRSQIEAKANEIIAAGSHNEIRFMPIEQMHTVCRHVPTNVPGNKPARVVLYAENFGIPCGGTHVRDVHDVGQIMVTKVKSKKGVTKVSYAVKGINA